VIGAETGAEQAEYQLKWSGYKKKSGARRAVSGIDQKNRFNVEQQTFCSTHMLS